MAAGTANTRPAAARFTVLAALGLVSQAALASAPPPPTFELATPTTLEMRTLDLRTLDSGTPELGVTAGGSPASSRGLLSATNAPSSPHQTAQLSDVNLRHNLLLAAATDPATMPTTVPTTVPACPPCVCTPCPACPGVGALPDASTVDYNVFTDHVEWWNYLAAAGVTVGWNVGLWSVVRIQGADFAKISGSSIKHNFSTGWEWDSDQFNTNQFAHPYQGSLYFSSARIFGLDFWESVPYAVFGSWQWEMFMENELPSFNDIITTSFGGIFFGEVLWRLSNAVLDDTTSGTERVLREIAGFAINPTNGLARLSTGKSWKHGDAPESNLIDGQLKFGYVGAKENDEDGWTKLFRFRAEIDYGDHFGASDLTTPFAWFEFDVSLLFDTGGIPGKSFDGTAVLYGWSLPIAPNVPTALGIYQHYDYYTNPLFNMGHSSVGAGWDGRLDLKRDFYFRWRWHLLFAFMGSVSSDYSKQYVGRNYNLGPGGQSIIELAFGHHRWGNVEFRSRRNVIYAASGASGWENTGVMEARLFFQVMNGVGIGGEWQMLDRQSVYQDHPDVNRTWHVFTGQVISTF